MTNLIQARINQTPCIYRRSLKHFRHGVESTLIEIHQQGLVYFAWFISHVPNQYDLGYPTAVSSCRLSSPPPPSIDHPPVTFERWRAASRERVHATHSNEGHLVYTQDSTGHPLRWRPETWVLLQPMINDGIDGQNCMYCSVRNAVCSPMYFEVSLTCISTSEITFDGLDLPFFALPCRMFIISRVYTLVCCVCL
jgi:hypothetical protein